MVTAHSLAAREDAVRFEAVRFAPCFASISFSIACGERVALLGRNGTGKTTLLRLAAGLEHPAGGGVDVHGRIGYVPQDAGASLLPWFRVRTNVVLGQRDAEEALAEALAVVPACAGLLDRWPSELSGGEQQLVALARAFACDPQLVLLDEPFSALDAAVRPAVRQSLLARIALRGATLVMVTHDDDDVSALAERVLRLDGRPARLHAAPMIWRRAQ